jgi:transketolase
MELRACVRYLISNPQPSYLRLDKNSNFQIHNSIPNIYPGQWVKISGNNNYDFCFLTTGSVIEHVKDKFEKRNNNHIYSLPLWGMKYKKFQYNFLKKYKKVYIFEDHFQDGGFQSWVNESLNKKNCKTKIISYSISSRVVNKVGSKEYLMNYLK